MRTDQESKDVSRRSFIQRTAMGGAGLLIATDILGSELAAGTPKSGNATMIGVPFEARDRVRLGIIGVGGRGSSLLEDLLAIEKIEVKAICDLVPEKVARAQKAVTKAGQAEPAGFSKGEWDFKNLTELDLDIVYIATPWNWHVPMAVTAMKNGKHAAVEVPACTTLQGVLGNRRYFRGYSQALRHSRELLLRLDRDDGPRHGAGWSLRRNHARRGGLSPRLAQYFDCE